MRNELNVRIALAAVILAWVLLIIGVVTREPRWAFGEPPVRHRPMEEVFP